MKKIRVLIALLFYTISVQASAATSNLQISFGENSGWNGKTIPADQLCEKFGGKGSTPPLYVQNIPQGAYQLRVLFNDETYAPMSNGGHGIIRFSVPAGSQSLTLHQLQGEIDLALSGVVVEQKHLATDWSGTGGAYLPPCSGGSGNTYSVKIQALDENNNITSEGRIILGIY